MSEQADTTLDGVSDANDNAVKEINNGSESLSKRDEDMSQIVINARKQREDSRDDGGESDELTPGMDDAPVEAKSIKVDGENIEVTQEEIDTAGSERALQQERASANRLRESTLLVKQNQAIFDQSQQLAKELAEREALLASQEQQNSDQLSSDTGSQEPTDTAKAITGKLLSADENEIASAVDEMMAQGKTSATEIDIDAITEQATKKAIFSTEKQLANAEFQTQFPDIFNNQSLLNLANEETKLLSAEHPEWGPRQVILEAAKTVQDQFGDTIKEKKMREEDDKRKSNKRATDQVSSASRRMPGKPEDKRLTPSEIVAQMAATRSAPQI